MAIDAMSLPTIVPRRERRILALVLPGLLEELVTQRNDIPGSCISSNYVSSGAASGSAASGSAASGGAASGSAASGSCIPGNYISGNGISGKVTSGQWQASGTPGAGGGGAAPRVARPVLEGHSARSSRGHTHPRGLRPTPRAIVLSELQRSMLEPTTLLDAVNAAARQLGVSTRQTIAQATALVAHLNVHVLPPACVSRALQRVAEAALGFGTPVSFLAPDTVWLDVTGTQHLFGGERELALALIAHVQALGHAVRVAGASGPWLAQSFARHADFDETGIYLVDPVQTHESSGLLPIGALPITREAVAWFARLGLLTLDDLRKLPRAALAARLEGQCLDPLRSETHRSETHRSETHHLGRALELIDGRDDGVLVAHLPEELPFEEQSWDFPLESVEPLLFVLKGLAARLGARLEGRGQAAQELLLTIRYDKSLAALNYQQERHLREQTKIQANPIDTPPRQKQIRLPSGHPRQEPSLKVPALHLLRGIEGRSPAARSAATLRPERAGASGAELVSAGHVEYPPTELLGRVGLLGQSAPPEALEIPFRLASPLAHAEDLERIVRSRLQKQTLFAPSIGVRLQVTAITEARQWQQSLAVDAGWSAALSEDPRTLAILMAELSADIGDDAIGMLEAHDSHLLEKSSCFVSLQQLAAEGRAPGSETAWKPLSIPSRSVSPSAVSIDREPNPQLPATGKSAECPVVPMTLASSARPAASPLGELGDGWGSVGVRHPTRLISPIEFKARLQEKEIVVIEQRAFVIEAIRFEERLEAVEWWASAPVSRDYFRLWLVSLSVGALGGAPASRFGAGLAGASSSGVRGQIAGKGGAGKSGTGKGGAWGAGPLDRAQVRGEGVEVLVYLNRDDGKKYVQAVYD